MLCAVGLGCSYCAKLAERFLAEFMMRGLEEISFSGVPNNFTDIVNHFILRVGFHNMIFWLVLIWILLTLSLMEHNVKKL